MLTRRNRLGALASPSSREPVHDQVPLIQSMFIQITDKNQKVKLNMEAQAKSQVAPEQTRFLYVVDLEMSQHKIDFSHATEISVGSTSNFKTVNLTVDTHNLPMLYKTNLHVKTRQFIVNDLHKANAIVSKA